MILGELNGAVGVDESSCAWEGWRRGGGSGCSMLFSGLASSLWSHSFHLGLALYLRCFSFGELGLLFCCFPAVHAPNPLGFAIERRGYGGVWASSGSQDPGRTPGP